MYSQSPQEKLCTIVCHPSLIFVLLYLSPIVAHITGSNQFITHFFLLQSVETAQSFLIVKGVFISYPSLISLFLPFLFVIFCSESSIVHMNCDWQKTIFNKLELIQIHFCMRSIY